MTNINQGFNRILVATDFSPHAEAALKQALWLARQVGASITLAHSLPDLRRVVHSASYRAKLDLLYGEGDVLEREVREKSASKMRQMIQDMNAANLNVKFDAFLGEPFVELTHAVQANGYDLVLAGTRGLAAWEQFFVGSTARRLIRKCPAAVWVVKADHIGLPKVVLAATDFSDVSLKAVKQGLWIAQQANAEFHLLHVIDSTDVPEDVIAKIPLESSLRNEITEQAKKRLEIYLDSIQADRSKIRLHLTWGTPWKEIKQMAQHISADLIAMGTVGRSGIKGMLLGNTAEKVLTTCDCSLLTVKADDFVSPI